MGSPRLRGATPAKMRIVLIEGATYGDDTGNFRYVSRIEGDIVSYVVRRSSGQKGSPPSGTSGDCSVRSFLRWAKRRALFAGTLS